MDFYSLLLYWCERPIVLAPGDDDMGSLLSRQHGAASWAYGWGRAAPAPIFFFFFVFLLSLLQKKNNGLTNISVFITTARCRVARGGARTCECDKQEGAHPHQNPSNCSYLSYSQILCTHGPV